jgi:NADH-quinone oxidoreductase subunit M
MMNSLDCIVIALPFILAAVNMKMTSAHDRRLFNEWSIWGISILLLYRILQVKAQDLIVIHSGSQYLLGFIYTFCFLSIRTLSPGEIETRKTDSLNLIGLGGVLGLFLTQEILFLIPFWICHLLPAWVEVSSCGKKWGLFHYFQAIGIAALTVGVCLLRSQGLNLNVDLHMDEAVTPLVSCGAILILVAALIRQGIFPFHWWIRDYTRKAQSYSTLIFLNSFAGLLLIQKVALPILHEDFKDVFPLLSFLTIFSSLYLALINTIENEVKIIFNYLIFSQSGLVAGGFELQESISNYGSLYQWIALMLTCTGLGLALTMILDRTGLHQLKRCYGFGEKAPRLGGFTVVLSFALVGVPGAMAFIGEDLLFHEIIEHYPIVGLGVLITAAINGLVGYRQYIYLYNGELDTNLVCPEIQPREAKVLACLVFFLFILGLLPNLILN